MSEIFKWLKKSDGDRRHGHADVIVLPEIENGADASQQVSIEAESVPHARPDLECDSSFDINAAEVNVKTVLDPISTVGEQYRILQAKLSLLQQQRGVKRLLITSALPSEGKTFTACCLAGVLAQEKHKKVLLVDADLRMANAWKLLGIKEVGEFKGLSHFLAGEIDMHQALYRSAESELYFLPAGKPALNPVELLSTPNLQRVANVWNRFDWVVIDSPPVVGLADTNLLASFCDAIILVVLANKTPVKLVQEAIERVGREKICGVILNRMKKLDSSRYYNYYYRQSVKQRLGVGSI